MIFLKAVIFAYKNAFDFKHRASRSDFLYFCIFYCVIFILLKSIAMHYSAPGMLDYLFVVRIEPNAMTRVLWLYFLVNIIPVLSISVRRLHDLNLSGMILLIPIGLCLFVLFGSPIAMMATPWLWVFIFLMIAIIVTFILFLFFKRGTEGKNKYGADRTIHF